MNDTKAQVRYNLNNEDVTDYMKQRLKTFYAKMVSKEGFLFTECGQNRERQQNLEVALRELQEALDYAAKPPPAAEDLRKNAPSPLALQRRKEAEIRSRRIEKAKKKINSIHC